MYPRTSSTRSRCSSRSFRPAGSTSSRTSRLVSGTQIRTSMVTRSEGSPTLSASSCALRALRLIVSSIARHQNQSSRRRSMLRSAASNLFVTLSLCVSPPRDTRSVMCTGFANTLAKSNKRLVAKGQRNLAKGAHLRISKSYSPNNLLKDRPSSSAAESWCSISNIVITIADEFTCGNIKCKNARLLNSAPAGYKVNSLTGC